MRVAPYDLEPSSCLFLDKDRSGFLADCIPMLNDAPKIKRHADLQSFMRELEQWLYAHFASYCTVRVEWSKGWAYTDQSGWSDDDVITRKIPASLTAGRPVAATFAAAAGQLNALDPHGVFESPLTRRLLG